MVEQPATRCSRKPSEPPAGVAVPPLTDPDERFYATTAVPNKAEHKAALKKDKKNTP